MKVVDLHAAPTPSRADPDEIRRALSILPEDLFEIRIPKAGRYRTIRGYFNDPVAATKAVCAWSGQVPAVYITLNPVNPALLARANNRLETYAENTTSDSDILSRRWLLIDLDPQRPSGISSSSSEHTAALKRCLDVRDWLTERGWPLPVYADSGNGGHLLYRIALANDSENTQTIQQVLQALAARFDTASVKVDTGVFNASRISKLYGTWACKGDHTADRPHRLSRILDAPADLEIVSLDLLEELEREIPPATPRHPPSPSVTRPSGDFFSSVNQAALDSLDSWVPRLFPTARPYRQGYRVTSRNLQRDCEEDLGIQPDGIKDFGLHDQGDRQGGRRTPIDLVMEWGQARDAKDAALWLCDQLGISPDRLGWRKSSAPLPPPPMMPEWPPIEAYEEDCQQPEPQPETLSPPSREFIRLADFIAAPPTHSYLIKRVLPARGIAQVFGSSNVGKSFLLIDLAMHVALGRPWRGCKTKSACVLYIAAEGLGGLSGRCKAWTQRYGLTPNDFYIRPYSVQLTVAGAALALAERINSLPTPPRLIILDTLAANFGPGDENSAEDMAMAMNGLRQLAGNWLAICAHHSGHADKTRSRGHSSLYAALDLEIQVSRDDPNGPIKVQHTKCRDMERMDPLFFSLEPEALPWADEDGEPIDSAVLMPCQDYEEPEKPKQPSGSQAKALQALRDLYATGLPRVTLEDWYAALPDMTKQSRYKLKCAMEEKGLIEVTHGFVYLCESPR